GLVLEKDVLVSSFAWPEVARGCSSAQCHCLFAGWWGCRGCDHDCGDAKEKHGRRSASRSPRPSRHHAQTCCSSAWAKNAVFSAGNCDGQCGSSSSSRCGARRSQCHALTGVCHTQAQVHVG